MAVLKNEYEISLWEDLETNECSYTPLTTKPLDWSTYYNTFYTKEYTTNTLAHGGSSEWLNNTYFSKSGDDYNLLTLKPDDWSENWNNYYIAFKKKTDTTWDDSVTYYRRFKKIKESKVGIIGSDSMTSLSRALEPCLTQNINGTNTFTFKMYYSYIDTQTGEKVDNSWIPLLVNEARLKVKWKSKWYDFVIKNRVEDSNGKSVTFSCEDLFVNELSKTGFNLEFDTELENNQGTVFELAKKVLADTDWTLVAPRVDETTYPTVDGKKFKAEVVQQYTEEPVYLCVRTNTSTSATDYVLLFYSQVTNEVKENLQMVYYDGSDYFPTDTNSLLVTRNKVQRIVQPTVSWSGRTVTYNGYSILVPSIVSSDYRAERLVDSQKSLYDAKAQKYVSVYADSQNNNKTTYGFVKTDYDTALMVTNCATWSETSTDGWEGDDLYWTLDPPFKDDTNIDEYNCKGFLRVKNQTIVNTSISSHGSFLPDGLQAGYRYRVRLKAKVGNDNRPTSQYHSRNYLIDHYGKLTIMLGPYNANKTSNFSDCTYYKNGDWIEASFRCDKSIPQKNLDTAKISVIWKKNEGQTLNLWITDFEFFQELRNDSNKLIYPGDFSAQSRSVVRYYYYYPASNTKATSLDDIKMVLVSEEESSRFKPVLNENNAKVRSISIKQSNSFNILQTLAETFQCWVKFGIGHYTTGEIRTRGSAPELPQKYVTFVNSIGEDKGYGFVYGIDLKTIQRTVESKQLVTKTIVQQNSNEYGEQGFCTIARAKDNVPKTNFILNLDYFVANGLLDGNVLAKDLYNKANGGLAYYVRLKEINTKYDKSLKKYTKLKQEYDQQSSLLDVYSKAKSATYDELNKTKNALMKICKVSTYKAVETYLKKNGTNDQTNSYLNEIGRLTNQFNNYSDLIKKLDGKTGSIAQIEQKIEQIEEDNKNYVKQLEDLDKTFNSKYGRYIQEGSWISEDYMDDNLYYLDGLSVAYTASRPQVQYSISVLRLTALEEFKYKIFNIGDIGFIEDKEFFGYENINGVLTPRKEQIIVSQIAEYFDSPEKDTITIQNYKTQFEDLFQRITSTTQSLQFSQGEYAKTAGTINSDGTIKADLLQSSLQQNLKIMMNATNESIIQDSTGITIVNINNPNKQMKLTSGGIIFTEDGVNWTTGVDSNGVRADYLKTGLLNTSEILIGSADAPQFRWDKDGINAYAWDQDKPTYGIIPGQFVRFDQYGLYGIQGNESFNSTGYYVPIAGWETVTSEPQDWATTYSNYFVYNIYTKTKDAVGGVAPTWSTVTSPSTYYRQVLVYEKLTSDEAPEDWATTYNSYFTYDSNTDTYIPVDEESAPPYQRDVYYRLTNGYEQLSVPAWQDDTYYVYVTADDDYILKETKPSNWATAYSNYYVEDGLQDSYVLTTSQPEDWTDNFNNYFIKIGDNEFESVSGETAPTWQENTYYKYEPYTKYAEVTSVSDAPADWSEEYATYYKISNNEYVPVNAVAPAWNNEATYYERTTNPEWQANVFYEYVNGDYQKLANKPDDWDDDPVKTIYYALMGTGLDAIKDYATFAFTWDGFFLKGAGDWISITSEDGFQIINPKFKFTSDAITPNYDRSYKTNKSAYTTNDYIPVVSLGRFYDTFTDTQLDNYSYGLRLRDYNGFVTLSTDSNGDIWSLRQLYVGTSMYDDYVLLTDNIAPDWWDYGFSNCYRYINGIYVQVIIVAPKFNDVVAEYGAVYDENEHQVNNEPADWDTNYFNYYTYSINPATGEDDFMPVTGVVPEYEPNKYYKFNNEGAIAGLNGTTLTSNQIINIKDILITIGALTTTETDTTETVETVRDGMDLELFKAINELPGSYTDASELEAGTYFVEGNGIDITDYAVRMWSGSDNTLSNSRFIVFKNGYIYAQQGYFEGEIHARNGNFSGQLTIGTNDAHGINGAANASYIFWSGKKTVDGVTSYQFYIDNTGRLYAQGVDISGTIDVQQGIIREIFLNPIGSSGLANDSIQIWINASDPEDRTTGQLYITSDGQLYTSDVFLRGTIGIEPLPVPVYQEGISYYVPKYVQVPPGTQYSPTGKYYKQQDQGYVEFENTIGTPDGWPTEFYTREGYDEVVDPPQGETVADNTWVQENGIYKQVLTEQYYKHGINDVEHGYVFWDGIFNNDNVPTPVSEKDDLLYNFYVNREGDVYARNLTLGESLNADSVILDAELKVGNITITSANNGLITNSNTWSIDGEGFAQFRNAKITGTLSTVAFEKESVSSVGGTLMVSPSQVLEQDLTGTPDLNSDKYKFVLNRSINENDRFGVEWDKVTEVSITYIGENTQGETAEITEKTILSHDNNELSFLFPISILPAGSIFISTDTDTSSIILSATDIYPKADNTEEDFGPHIIMSGKDDSQIIIGDLTKKLDGTSFEDIDEPDRGAGLYADNVYLEGQFYLPNAGMTNKGTNDESTRIWAGAGPTQRDTAPFRVTQDGSLYASKGVFSGTVNAVDSNFSGWLKTVGILIDPGDDPATPYRYENKFYIAYDNRSVDEHGNPINRDFPTKDDLILQIDRDGLSVWEGGFSVYTDSIDINSLPYIYHYYQQLPAGTAFEANTYYKYNEETNDYELLTTAPSDWVAPGNEGSANYYSYITKDSQIPYITAVEDLYGNQYRLLAAQIQVAQALTSGQYTMGVGIVSNGVVFEYTSSDNENTSYNALWDNNIFGIKLTDDGSALRILKEDNKFITFKEGLEEDFSWTDIDTEALDVGVTGSLNVRDIIRVKNGFRIGTKLDNAVQNGSQMQVKEFNYNGVYTKIDSSQSINYEQNKYYEYKDFKYTLLTDSSAPGDWNQSGSNYYSLNENNYNSEYSGFDFFVE